MQQMLQSGRGLTIGHRQDVAVGTERCAGVSVAKAILRGEDVASFDQERGHRMPQPVQRHVRMARVVTQRREPVAHAPGGQPCMFRIRSE